MHTMEIVQHTNLRGSSLPPWLMRKAVRAPEGTLVVHVDSPWKKGRFSSIQVPVNHTVMFDPLKDAWYVYEPSCLFPVYTLSRTGLSTLQDR